MMAKAVIESMVHSINRIRLEFKVFPGAACCGTPCTRINRIRLEFKAAWHQYG